MYCVMVFTVSFLLTKFINRFAIKSSIEDDPNSAKFRKFQINPIPLLGGNGAVVTSIIFTALLWLVQHYNIFGLRLLNLNLTPFRIIYLILAIFVLLFIGFLDDKYQLNPKFQFLGILMAIFICIFLGNIRINSITIFNDFNYIISIAITTIWLGFCTASTKFLDGHDGLVVTVGMFNFLTIAHISLLSYINQPLVFLLSLTWTMALIPTLFKNFPQASSYIGEGASEIIGFSIGALAILSGAKVATTLSILGWFILDIFLVWLIRLFDGRNPITSSDRNHWHHRLLRVGFNKLQVLIITWIILIISSFIGVYGDTYQKTTLLAFQILLMIIIFVYTSINDTTKNDKYDSTNA